MRKPAFFTSLSQGRLVGGALVLAITQLGASVMGLVRERALNQTFPGLSVVDVYISSFRISDLLFQVCIMAGYSVALIPLLARYHADKDMNETSDLLSGVVGIAALVFGGIAALLAVFMPVIAPWAVNFEGETLSLYITFARLALLSNFLFVFGNAFGQYLVTVQRYWIYGITPILYTLGTVLGTLYLSGPDQYGQLGPMIGTLYGGVAYVVIRLFAVLHTGCQLRFRFWHPDIPEFFRLMLPRMVALGALQLQLLLFDTVASGLTAGSVTINANARNFQSVAVGVAGIALAQSAFSLLSQAMSKRESARFWRYLKKGITVLVTVTVPAAIALVLLAPVAAWLVHLESRLDIFRWVLLWYAISIPFESVNHLLLRAFYAAKDTVTPATFSVLNGGVAITLTWLLVPTIGVFALPIGFTVGQVMQLVGLSLLLPDTVERVMKNESIWTRFRRRFSTKKSVDTLPTDLL